MIASFFYHLVKWQDIISDMNIGETRSCILFIPVFFKKRSVSAKERHKSGASTSPLKKTSTRTGFPREVQCLSEDFVLIGSDMRVSPGKDYGAQGKIIRGSGIEVNNGHDFHEKSVVFRLLSFLVRYARYLNPVTKKYPPVFV